jgi:hypothetical protein
VSCSALARDRIREASLTAVVLAGHAPGFLKGAFARAMAEAGREYAAELCEDVAALFAEPHAGSLAAGLGP